MNVIQDLSKTMSQDHLLHENKQSVSLCLKIPKNLVVEVFLMAIFFKVAGVRKTLRGDFCKNFAVLTRRILQRGTIL
jgi:hypothetical protein